MVDRVDLDDRHVVSVDRERVVGIARERHQAEPVALALLDRDDRKVGACALRRRGAPEAVDESRVSPGRETRALTRKDVRPVRQGDDGGLCNA